MKNYTITVNGTVYDVTVEEGGKGSVPAARPAAPAPVAPVPAPAAAAPEAPTPAAPKAPAAQGNISVTSPMPGKILNIKANVGQAVKKGDVIVILEAMKMENEIVSPEDGTVAGINVTVGEMVDSGSVIATLN